jgi:hypothetical protein
VSSLSVTITPHTGVAAAVLAAAALQLAPLLLPLLPLLLAGVAAAPAAAPAMDEGPQPISLAVAGGWAARPTSQQACNPAT